MALEDITAGHTIANLVITNPADGDDLSNGDDHIRNLKKALQYTFPNISATASGVAAEFAFAHKGGTVSGNAVILGTLSASGAVNFATTLSVSGAAVMKSGVTMESSLTVSGTMVAKGSTTICPIGAILPYAGTTAPAGFLLCDGAAVSRTTYAALFAVTSTTFGVGDGSTTFNVPDLRGRAPVGLDNLGGTSANRITGTWADALGSASGAETHILTIAEMPAHTHTVTAENVFSNADISNASGNAGSTNTGSTGGGGAHNNVQPSIALGYIIRSAI